jgi:hypothetical protein
MIVYDIYIMQKRAVFARNYVNPKTSVWSVVTFIPHVLYWLIPVVVCYALLINE